MPIILSDWIGLVTGALRQYDINFYSASPLSTGDRNTVGRVVNKNHVTFKLGTRAQEDASGREAFFEIFDHEAEMHEPVIRIVHRTFVHQENHVDPKVWRCEKRLAPNAPPEVLTTTVLSRSLEWVESLTIISLESCTT